MDPGTDHGVRFRLLGTVEVTAGGRAVEIGSAKQRALLAALLLRLNHVVPVEVLVEDLWGGSPPATVHATLQSLVSRLRRVLDACGDTSRLRARDGGYVLEAAPDRVDAVRFERLAAAARRDLADGDAAGAADALQEALGLWRGDALGDLADRPFARPEAQRLEEARLGAVEDLAGALLALGRSRDSLALLETHIARHPLRERPWGQVMLALYRLGRQADALNTFHRLRRLLAEELGVEPMPELRRLAGRILHQDADLCEPARPGGQATHPGLPPPRSPDARRHNLPVPLTSFVGRTRELAEVVELLATSRLLTLAGAGGTGKTRLALQAATGTLARYPDGAWLVELAPVRDPAVVADEVVTALGLLPGALVRAGESLESRLCDHLEGRRLLLVLDNCEHVVDAAARLAQAVLTRCPEVTVLATSREVLGVPGEVVWKVPPLSMPPVAPAGVEELAASDAVALFCERARAAQPGFGLSAANAPAVARICRRLDGIPLGLELAAGKIRVLGAHQVAERLDDRFRLLTGGSRTGVPRHQTLRAAMDWSYALLPAPEQAVLRRLSAFRGTSALDAAEAVVGAVPPEPTSRADFTVLDVLTRLVDKSMVSVTADEPEVRYGLLETVREYAGQKLTEAGEADDVRARHRDFFLGLADQWATTSDYWNWWLWLRRIDADHDDFAAALEFSRASGDDDALLRLAAAHWPYWYWGEGLGWRRWLVEALDRCRRPGPARVEALIGLASLLMRSGEDAARCEALFAEARDVAVGLPDGQPVAQVDFYRAHALLSEGEPRKAESLLRDATRRSTNADFLGWCRWGLGWIALLDDQLDEAATEFSISLALGDGVDDESMRAHVCSALALVAALRGDHRAAGALAARAIRSAERLVGAPRVLMLALARAGQVAALCDDGHAAVTVSRLLRMLRDKGVTYWADETLAVAGLVLADRAPEHAALALCGADDGDDGIAAMSDRISRCRARLAETLGPRAWQAARERARAMPVEAAMAAALAALEASEPVGTETDDSG